jgi:copper chaperone
MAYTIAVENIKCGGCAASIRNKLIDSDLAAAVDVDVEHGAVHIDGDPARRPEAVARLASLGYPEVGSVEGLKAAAAKAKSFVSCAVGRMDGGNDDRRNEPGPG